MPYVSLFTIDPCNQENENCLMCLLKQAIEEVELNYYFFQYQQIRRGYQLPERAFTSELYHQLRKIQDNSPNRCNIKDNIFQTEIGKTPENDVWNVDCKSYNIERKRIVPDLVFHKYQNNRSFQGFACEIKTSINISIINLISDLEKLIIYKSNYLNFEYACFIFLGEKDKLEELLNDVFDYNSHLIECLIKNKIFFFIKNKSAKYTKSTTVYHLQINN